MKMVNVSTKSSSVSKRRSLFTCTVLLVALYLLNTPRSVQAHQDEQLERSARSVDLSEASSEELAVAESKGAGGALGGGAGAKAAFKKGTFKLISYK